MICKAKVSIASKPIGIIIYLSLTFKLYLVILKVGLGGAAPEDFFFFRSAATPPNERREFSEGFALQTSLSQRIKSELNGYRVWAQPERKPFHNVGSTGNTMLQYTPEQMAKRDSSIWTKVQMVLAPVQFIAFLISFSLVVRYLVTGEGYAAANISVLIKIALLWMITITGMIWEKELFGHYFLAKEFFWEDVGNAVAIVTHNIYFVAVWAGADQQTVMGLMLLAYCTYLINCAQFVRRGIAAGQQRRAARAAQEQSVISTDRPYSNPM